MKQNAKDYLYLIKELKPKRVFVDDSGFKCITWFDVDGVRYLVKVLRIKHIAEMFDYLNRLPPSIRVLDVSNVRMFKL